MRALVIARRTWFGEGELATADAGEVAERFLRLAGASLTADEVTWQAGIAGSFRRR